MNPDQALDLHLDTITSLRNPWHARYVDLYFNRLGDDGRALARRLFPGVTPDEYAESIAQTLNESDTILVRADMARAITDAAATMPDWTLRPADLPSPHGFAVMETPLRHHDIHGNVMTTRVLSWAAGSDGIAVMDWNHRRDPGDFYSAQLADEYGDDINRLPLLMVQHVMTWRYGESWRDYIARMEAQDPDRGHTLRERVTWLLALWLFMGQRIGYRTTHDPARAARRRARRANMPDDGRVVVVRLRRRVPVDPDQGRPGGPSDGPRWTHRWTVAGHWRNQWYPSEQRHRPKWVAPYVKGPDWLPLVTKDRVYDVTD